MVLYTLFSSTTVIFPVVTLLFVAPVPEGLVVCSSFTGFFVVVSFSVGFLVVVSCSAGFLVVISSSICSVVVWFCCSPNVVVSVDASSLGVSSSLLVLSLSFFSTEFVVIFSSFSLPLHAVIDNDKPNTNAVNIYKFCFLIVNLLSMLQLYQ